MAIALTGLLEGQATLQVRN